MTPEGFIVVSLLVLAAIAAFVDIDIKRRKKNAARKLLGDIKCYATKHIRSWKALMPQILSTNEQKELKDIMSEDNSSICEDCLGADLDKKYSYLFDTGFCEKCNNTHDVVYMPLLNLYHIHSNLNPMDWYGSMPRKKIDIELVFSDEYLATI